MNAKPARVFRSSATPGGNTDIFTRKKRSAVMARIHGSGNKSTELRLVHLFRFHKITGWRRGSALPGRPDFVFSQRKTAVFVDGCFWHGCPKHGAKPKNNAEFWRQKIAANKTRDRRVNRELRALGWSVLRIWEHELAKKNSGRLLARLQRALSAPAFAQSVAKRGKHRNAV